MRRRRLFTAGSMLALVCLSVVGCSGSSSDLSLRCSAAVSAAQSTTSTLSPGVPAVGPLAFGTQFDFCHAWLVTALSVTPYGSDPPAPDGSGMIVRRYDVRARQCAEFDFVGFREEQPPAWFLYDAAGDRYDEWHIPPNSLPVYPNLPARLNKGSCVTDDYVLATPAAVRPTTVGWGLAGPGNESSVVSWTVPPM